MAQPTPSPPIGVLLVNLGTPDAPRAPEVRRYLREFLSDPRVLDISPLGRWLLLNLIILPLRPARSAEAYQKIWTAEGSPLLTHSRDLCERVRAAVPDLGYDEGVDLWYEYAPGAPHSELAWAARVDVPLAAFAAL